MIEAYVYASCTSCRKTSDALKASGADYTSRDYFKDRFARDELAGLLERAGLDPFDVLSKRSKVYKARATEIDGLSSDQLLDLMVDEPTLLRRPLVIGGNEVIIGHHPSQLEQMISPMNRPEHP